MIVITTILFTSTTVRGQATSPPPDAAPDVSDRVEPAPKKKQTPAEQVDTPIVGISFENPVNSKWKVGVRVTGGSSPALNVFVSIPVPNDWPEQRVTMADEALPPTVGDVKFRDLESGVRQLIITIPRLNANEEVELTTTFLVATSQINAPPDPTIFVRPKTAHRAGKQYLGESPDIHFHDSKIRKQVKELTTDKANIWQEIESIYDWVRDNIEQRDSEPADSVAVFRDQVGSEEDKVGLFIALCRAHKIPARMVWVEGSFHAEFMLVDRNADPHWFPCNVVGIREFGSIAEPRVIVQKGDSIRVPEKEIRQKFVREFMSCQGQSKPGVEFIRELLPADD